MPNKNVYMTAGTINQLKELNSEHGYSHSESVRLGVDHLAKSKLKQPPKHTRKEKTK